MSQDRLSIKGRLHKARSLESKREVLTSWAANWQNEQRYLLAELQNPKARFSNDELIRQLKAVTEKRFPALLRVFETLLEGYTIPDKPREPNE
jgi:hypothetical protein